MACSITHPTLLASFDHPVPTLEFVAHHVPAKIPKGCEPGPSEEGHARQKAAEELASKNRT